MNTSNEIYSQALAESKAQLEYVVQFKKGLVAAVDNPELEKNFDEFYESDVTIIMNGHEFVLVNDWSIIDVLIERLEQQTYDLCCVQYGVEEANSQFPGYNHI